VIFDTPITFEEALRSQLVKDLFPTSLSSVELAKLGPDILERARFSARVTDYRILDEMDRLLNRLIEPTVIVDKATGLRRAAQAGESVDPSLFRTEMKGFLDSIGYEPDAGKRGTIQDLSSDRRLNLIADTNTKMAHGYGNWTQGQTSAILDEFPAQELIRSGSRMVPRDWPRRWAEAGGEFFNGRMIARKDSPIWSAISRFGTPYPPFDYNSGMDLADIDRDEAVEFGIVSASEQVPTQSRPFNETLGITQPKEQSSLLDGLLDQLGDSVELVDGRLQVA